MLPLPTRQGHGAPRKSQWLFWLPPTRITLHCIHSSHAHIPECIVINTIDTGSCYQTYFRFLFFTFGLEQDLLAWRARSRTCSSDRLPQHRITHCSNCEVMHSGAAWCWRRHSRKPGLPGVPMGVAGAKTGGDGSEPAPPEAANLHRNNSVHSNIEGDQVRTEDVASLHFGASIII
jgi:hypothetical protein